MDDRKQADSQWEYWCQSLFYDGFFFRKRNNVLKLFLDIFDSNNCCGRDVSVCQVTKACQDVCVKSQRHVKL